MIEILDPRIKTAREVIDYVPRPSRLRGLRIGLVENTKKNSEAVLTRLAEKLNALHGMTMQVLVHKAQRAPLLDAQIAQLRGSADFVIVGVGD
jgi:hypothetical protein